ncbi:MAG: hypothetical protein WDO70_00985 [Alphaproteobacteria bacterium]
MITGKDKPSFDIWLRWADVLARRLDTVRQVYEDHGDHDSTAKTAVYLGQLQHVLAGALARYLSGQPYAALNQLSHGQEKLDETQIRALAGIFRAALDALPKISRDMQKLLHSKWNGECSGRLASDLFKGPRGAVNEGIGSGLPHDGQLPQALDALLRQEETGEQRPARVSALSADQQQRWTDTARRWADQNSGHLRRAGSVE